MSKKNKKKSKNNKNNKKKTQSVKNKGIQPTKDLNIRNTESKSNTAKEENQITQELTVTDKITSQPEVETNTGKQTLEVQKEVSNCDNNEAEPSYNYESNNNDNQNKSTENKPCESIVNNEHKENKIPNEDVKKEIIANKSNKNKKTALTLCIATAIGSSLVTAGTIKMISPKNSNTTDQTSSTIDENSISVLSIGESLEKKQLIDADDMFTIDYSFDSRFEDFKENIIEIYTKVSNSDSELQEVFLIKSDDPDKVEEKLKDYQLSLVSKYEKDNKLKESLATAKNAVIKTKQGITYFIASKNITEIEKMILNEMNL